MRRLAPVVVLFLALLGSQGTHAEDAVVIKFSHILHADTPKGRAALKFKELVEKRTQGKLTVEVYPDGRLFGYKEELDALVENKVQMLAPSFPHFIESGAHDLELFRLPFLFPSLDAVHRVMDGAVGYTLLSNLDRSGLYVGLAYWDKGFQQMSANRPLRAVADFKGLRMRITPSNISADTMKAFGANPRILTLDETYRALQMGLMDGTEDSLSNFYTQKFHKVQKHLTMSNHNFSGYVVVINRKFWDSLSADNRFAVSHAIKEATAFERQIVQQEENRALEQIRAAKTTEIHVLSTAERNAWSKALLPVNAQYEGVAGKNVLDFVRDEIGK